MKNLFFEALQHPSPGFALGKCLAELHPGLALVTGEVSQFDVQTFARDGHCSILQRDDLFAQHDTNWSPDHGVWRRFAIGWWKVTWDGTSLDVVLLEWPTRMYSDKRRFFVLAPTRERGEAFVAAVCRWSHEVRGEVLVFTDGCFQKSRKIHEAISTANFDQVVLNGTLKQQIRDDFAHFLSSRTAYEEAGVPWKRGALFIGPPGNGKTLCVKALVSELGIPCLYIQSFAAREYSTPQSSIETVFKRARTTTPCVLVLEDIDALLIDGTRSFFLNELDGFAANAGIITLATTNHPERLDPSIVDRPSRFDRKYHFDLPTAPARAEYIGARNARLHANLRLGDEGSAQLVELTTDFSFAYLQELFVSSMMRYMAVGGAAATGFQSVVFEQVGLLRAQLKTVPAIEELPPEPRGRRRPF